MQSNKVNFYKKNVKSEETMAKRDEKIRIIPVKFPGKMV